MRTYLVAGMALAAALALMGGAASAATQTFSLNVADPAAGLGTGPWGTMTVDDAGGVLAFSVALADGSRFNRTNNANHHGFTFELDGDPTITVSGLPAGWTVASGSSFNAPPLGGGWDYALDWNVGGKGGYANGYAGPLNFVVTAANSLSLASIRFNTATVGGQSEQIYATADLVRSNGSTGNVGAILGPIPEPTSWAMMVMGFMGLGAMLRIQRRRDSYAA